MHLVVLTRFVAFTYLLLNVSTSFYQYNGDYRCRNPSCGAFFVNCKLQLHTIISCIVISLYCVNVI